LAAAVAAALTRAAFGENPPADPAAPAPAPVNETVVVSATQSSEIETEIPGNVTVVTGDELRRRNVHTLADALEDVVGIDTGIGSDNGVQVPTVGMWGLKEFDALLFMVDGVPVGGPFNPNLSQINVDDIDRIEIVKGPQGTLYGVSGFAGMVQIFTRTSEKGSHVTLTGGSFQHGRLDATTNVPLGTGSLRLFGTFDRTDGWQDRTDGRDDRGGIRFDQALGGGHFSAVFNAIRTTQLWGSPLPVDPPTGEVIPGFRVDRNYAVDGARQDHRVFSLTTGFDKSLSTAVTLVNTLSYAHDDQISVRSFVDPGSVEDGTVASSGVSLKPTEEALFEDFHILANFQGAGSHRLVAGAALTWGRTVAAGTGFDFTVGLDPIDVPALGDIPVGDHRSFNDRRTFFGIYVNDEWNPLPWLEITAGARHDWVEEELFAKGQEVGDPEAGVSRDSRSDAQWSGGLSGLFRLVGDKSGALNEANIYVAAKSAFKPAAPNLTEAESAEILKPERTRSGEIGVKTRWLDRQLSFNLSFFHMIFENLVVSTLGADGNPALVNAGKERFQGMEIQAGYRPNVLPDIELIGGYAHHDARYVDFTFIDPDEGLLDASGQRLELTPRDLWNVKLAWLPASGPGAWTAVRHQNHRPFDKINEAYMPSFYEWDAGVSWSFSAHARLSFVGRNLGDNRHYVAESEIGDAQLYVAPPRRFLGELTLSF
jgi:outer membrane receptor protein involved in Fe transport